MAGNESKIIMDFIIRGIGDAKKQIEDVRKAIKSLSGTVTRTSTGLNNINEGLNKIGKSGKLAGKSLDDASKSTRKANVSFREMGQAIGDIGRGLALMGAAATAALAVSAKEAIKFEEAMYNINAIAKVSTHELKMMADGARELAKRLDVKDTATGVAQAMHTLVLSGIESSKALDIAGVSAKAAAAGMSDTKTAVKALSALMNSYNKKTVQDSITFSDQLFKIVERGVLTFEGLAENLGAVVAIASPMGVAFEEVGAAYIELTRSGISVAEAETAIASLLRQLGAPSKTAKKNAAELGLEIGDVALKTKGLNGMLFELMEATGGSEEAIKSIIPDWRGMKALLALTKNEGLAYADSLREMKNAQDGVGATQKALNEQMKSTAFQLAQLNAYWTDLKIELGNILTEIAMPFIQFMKSLIAGFTALPDGLQKAIVIVGLLTAGLGALGAALSVISFVLPPLILVFGKIAGAFSMAYAESSIVYAAFWKLVSVVTTLNPAILAMVAVFTGWLAILTAIYNIFPAFAEKVDWLGGILKNYLIGNLQLLGDKLGWLKDKFFELIDAIQFWADNKASDKAAKIELENAKKITNGIKELTEEGTKQKKQRLKDIEEEYKARVESLKKNKKLTDEFRNAQIKAAKERYEIQKDIIERSDVLTVEQIKKIRDSYQVLADRSTNPRARNRNLADWKKWNDRLIAEEQLRLSLGDEAKQRTEKRLTGFGGVDVKAEKDDYDKYAKMVRDNAAEILKIQVDEYNHRRLLSANAYQDELDNIDKLKVAEEDRIVLRDQAWSKHEARLTKIIEDEAEAREKATTELFLEETKAAEESAKAWAEAYNKQAKANEELVDEMLANILRQEEIEEQIQIDKVNRANDLLSHITGIAGSIAQTFKESNNKTLQGFSKLFSSVSQGASDMYSIMQNPLSAITILVDELTESVDDWAYAMDYANQMNEDGVVTMDELNTASMNLISAIPIIGDLFVAISEAAGAATWAVLNFFGIFKDFSTESMLLMFENSIQMMESMLKQFNSEWERINADRQREVKNAYNTLKKSIKDAYDAEKEAIDNNIKQFQDKIDVYESEIRRLKDLFDELTGQDFRAETAAEFGTKTQQYKASADPDLFRTSITLFELESEKTLANLQNQLLRGEINIDQMNAAMMEEAVKRNVYYQAMADDLEAGTREQWEYQKLANEAFEDYSDLRVKDREAGLNAQIKEQQAFIDAEQDKIDAQKKTLDFVKYTYDLQAQYLEDSFKDASGNFRDAALLDIDKISNEIYGIAGTLNSIAFGELNSYMTQLDTTFESARLKFTEIWATMGYLNDASSDLRDDILQMESALSDLKQGKEDYESTLSAPTIENDAQQVLWDTANRMFLTALNPLAGLTSMFFAKGGVADQPSIFGEAGPEAAFTAQQVKGMYDYIVSSTMGGGSGGGLTINVGQVVANNPQEFTKQLKSNMPYIQKQLGKSYRNAYAN